MPGLPLPLGAGQAPEVAFGAVAGAQAGDFLQIAYASDEPIDRAYIVAGDRRMALSVHPDRLEVHLPPAWPSGWSAIEVWDADGFDVTYLQVVKIAELPVQVGMGWSSFGTGGGAPANYRPTIRQVRTGRAQLAIRTRDRVGRPARRTRSAVQASHVETSVTRDMNARRTSAAVLTRSAVNVPPATSSASTGGSTRATIVGRRDGPELEAALLLELL